MSGPGDGGGGDGGLRRGFGALERFRGRLHTLLAELESSAAAESRIAAHAVPRTALSGQNVRFAEADGLYAQYGRVHEELVSLSRSLGDRIECLGLGVHAAAVGFDHVDDEVRRRFHEIRAGLDEQREKVRGEDGGRLEQSRCDSKSGSRYDDLGAS
ncbi:hypothetical protein ACFU6R_15110 [Streptomyces sp. NPDC057499]|uniref:hypothetical protein n=1 Tax=Streptomyces sp. NPDC057499 TaxID=3346150 RepID=UPI003679CC26